MSDDCPDPGALCPCCATFVGPGGHPVTYTDAVQAFIERLSRIIDAHRLGPDAAAGIVHDAALYAGECAADAVAAAEEIAGAEAGDEGTAWP